jgi:hypothetical protein
MTKERQHNNQVKVNLSDKQHRQIRIIAAEEGVPMSVIANRELSRFLSRQPISRPGQDRDQSRGGGK